MPYNTETDALTLVTALFAASADFVALFGTNVVVEDDATPETTAHAIITAGDTDMERTDINSFVGTITVEAELLWPPGTLTLAQARNHVSTIRQEIFTACGLGLVGIKTARPLILAEADALAGWYSAMFTFTIRVVEP